MAASVYATPPPDFSGEDTALSDVSNSSQLSSSSSQSKVTKRNISTALLSNQTRTNSFDSMQLDQSKKRRKQSTPIRLSALNLSTDVTNSTKQSNDNGNEIKLQKLILPNLEQLQTATATIVSLQQSQHNISPLSGLRISPKPSLDHNEHQNIEDQTKTDDSEVVSIPDSNSLKDCTQCDEQFDSELKLGVHIIKNHAVKKIKNIENEDKNEECELVHSKVKEDQEINESSGQGENRLAPNISRPEDWLSMPALGFPFPPEAAAAALTASNYLSQLPILSVPPVGAFPSVESLSRPPLRIFNPEAFCDLCNKEFCNKYFLKTHKANKHGIYDPAGPSGESPTGNQLNSITQVLQMQFQQQHQQQQQQQQPNSQQQHQLQNERLLQQSPIQLQQSQQQQQQQQPNQIQLPQQHTHQTQNQQQQQPQIPQQKEQLKSPQSPTQSPLLPSEPAVFCDICNKRFTNIFAMKKHRSKTHEISSPNSPHQAKIDTDSGIVCDKEIFTPFRLPEGFREDFSIEQEDVSFTPQPRKLSPSSIQQAREANFSFDKLKRLGVLNPEAFCDLCCKEYCNKYFLRTHKLKRHGILIPDDSKDEKLQWPFIQTAPLNLMIASERLQRKQIEDDEYSKQSISFNQSDEESSPKKLNGDGQNQITKVTNINRNTEITENPGQSIELPNLSQDAEAISIDLQKLQSMILQLNDLSGQRPVCCNICGKEVENQYMLHAHIATEHSGDNNSGINSQPASPSTSVHQPETCKQCDKEFLNVFDLKQHIMDVHGVSLNSPIREGFVTPDRPIIPGGGGPPTPNQNERRPPYTITPTSSYCEICNKELCNKYFMKTHMQRMHGIEIENGAQIGGVVCNICNKELCSKYFLRVHKHNTHGIVDEGSPLPQTRQNGDQPESEGIFPLDSKMDLTDLSTRYFTHYTEVCPLCSRRFRSSKWLRAHLMSDHGKAGTDKLREMEQNMSFSKPSSPTLKIPNGGLGLNNLDPDMLTKGTFSNLFMNDDAVSSSSRFKEYQCSMCSFSTPYYAFLFIHERSHTFLTQNSTLIKSETAVSIAKDQDRVTQPSTTTISSSETPTTTPASTPIPQTPQENANGSKQQEQQKLPQLQKQELQKNHQEQQEQQEQHQQQEQQQQQEEHHQKYQQQEQKQKQQQQQNQHEQHQHEHLPYQQQQLIGQMKQKQFLHCDIPNSLGDLARLSNRPASYAVPQNFGGEMMQSFFIEEAKIPGKNNNNATDINTSFNPGNESINNNNDSSNINRFVPAVVFLPVRERISGPITVSFTLTPA